jgi:hypothetical protein
MATKVNMLKLVHEVSEFARLMPRRPQQNRSGSSAINLAVVNPLRNPIKRWRLIPVAMLTRADIPTPIKISFRPPRVQS